MSSSVHRNVVTAGEHIVVVGAGFNGLMCALEAQGRRKDRQVDIVAQAFLTDPQPTSWTTYFSRCFVGRLKSTYSDLEQKTFEYLQGRCAADRGVLHRFPLTEYFSMVKLDQAKLLLLSECQDLPPEALAPGAKHGWSFSSISINPVQLATQMQYDFATNGGRIFRGTVRHVQEIVDGGVGSFQRAVLGDTTHAPTAIVICVGLGARTMGGIEDGTVAPVQMHVLRLRMPKLTVGRAFYDEPEAPALFVVPLGNGDVIVGGCIERNCWFPRPRRKQVEELLAKVLQLCPEIVPEDVEDKANFDLHPFIVWEGCDTFGSRKQGPRLDVQVMRCQEEARDIPVLISYGHGFSELQSHRELAKVSIDLLEAALGQERGDGSQSMA